MRGKFITLEGCDGVGKTTQIRRLQRELNKAGVDFVFTREPGGTVISERIRDIILDASLKEMDAYTEILLYAAARRQHVAEFIEKKLAAGTTVFCDRFVDSTLAYQGYARNLGIDNVYNINMYATNGFLPDLTILIDIPPEVGLERIKKNSREVDRLDLEKISFHKKVHEGYLLVSKKFSSRIVIVDGNKPLDDVYKDVKKIIEERLKLRS